MNLKTTLLFSVLACLFLSGLHAQNGNDWSRSTRQITQQEVGFRNDHMPTTFELFNLDIENLKSKLYNAPKRGEFFGKSNHIISVPTTGGNFERFGVLDTQTLHPELQAKYPNIRSYVAQSLDNPGNYMRFSVTNSGLHASISRPGQSTVYIDPYTKDKSVYMVYKRDHLVNLSVGEFSCETDNSFVEVDRGSFPSNTLRATNDTKIRVFELALSCTGEYAQLFAGTGDEATQKANVLSEMVVAMSRVNSVYEKEMGITFELIPNTDLIIYLDPETDPWDGEYNDKTQEVIDMVIGDENYDIGHNFNTSGGGNAGCIGCVCNSGNKGSGYTGLPNPTGDPFYIDYVAHEMGHQIGGYHTNNGTLTCLKSGNNTEVEPGSGSTIMGYAGICLGQNVQDQSDDYFNYVNIRDISANIQSGVSSFCPDIIETSTINNAPTADAGADYTIPINTAFQLTGVGEDPDSDDILTYTWEQNDNEDMQSPLLPIALATAGPMFRSRRGTVEPFRFFPQLSDILDNNLTPTWEVIPSNQRDFEFALTVRDNVMYAGQTADDLMTLSTDILAGPFEVSSQNNATTWIQGETETISWNVAGTDGTSVNCQIVNILFSAAGDFSDTVVLALNTLNDGDEDITVPPTLTTTGRLMVKAADNVFLDVNDSAITIEESVEATFFLTANEVEKDACSNAGSETLTFTYTPSSSFTETVTYSATGLPTGASATFSPETSSTTTETVTMTISGFENASSGDYVITYQGDSGSLSKTQDATISLIGTNFDTPSLSAPANNSENQSTSPQYMWSEDSTGASESYTIEVSTNETFTNIIETATVETTMYNSSIVLNESTNYYWRVKPFNDCGEAEFTNSNQFTTGVSTCNSEENTSATLTSSIVSVTSSITIDDDLPISDINVLIDLKHTYVSDLTLELESPSGTTVVLISGACGEEDDILATFDDAGNVNSCSGTPTVNGTVRPQDALSAFNNESTQGTWTLTISDSFIGDDGTLDYWAIEYCGIDEVLTTNDVTLTNDIIMYPNPSNTTVNFSFSNSKNLDVKLFDMLGRSVLKTTLSQANNTVNVSNLATGAYLVQIKTDNGKTTTKRLIVE
ncbi:reprolysin-like metallopeptidase [Croceibacter atlanticus]|jgi:subtilisin-like proprotein convertase family protein|uniref:reprolysin-like metallopeptidase n=2 Tax=Croceibacter atlanticus TaxID=313588 RepID=UPI0024B96E8B|nr:zinc-dependent metalloprotease family protein [Croceibacter atlanticus]WSP34566.1 zinc-dependent metalloprotease family protein [Croceibacter atlanticus]|tara:strand:+ start:141952 stop:145233 length:3282 start_codon:yes stop_codon:yes gene_type:complete